MTSFSEVLAGRLRQDAGRPLVTYYNESHNDSHNDSHNESHGERTELSVATYANWVAKAASLLVDELGLGRGDRLRVDLPAHWLTTVFLGAAWHAGLVVTDEAGDDGRPDAVVTGPERLAAWAPYAESVPVLACSLLPLGARFADPLPPGVHDVGAEIWSQPDAFVPWDPPSGADPAVAMRGLALTQQQLWEAAAAASPQGGRLLSEANPASPPGLVSFTGPLATGGSVVLVAHAGPDRLEAIALAERVTDRFPRAGTEDSS